MERGVGLNNNKMDNQLAKIISSGGLSFGLNDPAMAMTNQTQRESYKSGGTVPYYNQNGDRHSSNTNTTIQ